MKEDQIKLTIGSLLHDIGKIVYRTGDGRNHSYSGYEYLKELGIEDTSILNCVLYHHGSHLKNAEIAESDNAYLTYYADNIAAAIDRREGDVSEDGFDKGAPLASIFNILNGNSQNFHFEKQILGEDNGINYPTDKPIKMDESFYKKVIRNITDDLKAISLTDEYVNSLLSILEVNLSYIPSSTSRRELADISLFDHMKMTAAIAVCMQEYLSEHNVTQYRDKLFINAQKTYEEKSFLLYSMDISGIQSFIYTISSEGALRSLRSRSFYLEILMEHIVDELLKALSLSRTSLLYTGGGHCYMLLPNTINVKETINKYEHLTNEWFMDNFGTALFIAGGYAECSANDLKNEPHGSFSELYRTVSKKISERKAHRYSAEDIIKLNGRKNDGERECSVCRKVDKVDSDRRCPICSSLYKMSTNILYENFFTVINRYEQEALPLPGGFYLIAEEESSLKKRMESDEYVRCYTKNGIYTGKHVTTKLWIGNYTTGDTFDEFTNKARGIERLGVLRADVDNLGSTFVSGFRTKSGDDRYATLSRTATLSRQLSLFFKFYINQILSEGESSWLSSKGLRNVSIVYSGGDDIFIVGAWNEVIDVFIDIKNDFQRFTQNALTISGGIEIYSSGYPINLMASEVAELEEMSKAYEGKNAITLFSDEGTYSWDVFNKKVLAEKYEVIKDFFDGSDERGKAFLYHLLELLRNTEEKINFARYVYLLSRMEPDKDSSEEQKKAYKYFSQKMYEWIKVPEERRQVITALYLYVYLNRNKEEN